MAAMAPGGASSSEIYKGNAPRLLLPTWVVIGVFLLVPVALMAIYSFLTKEFRGGVIWEFTLAAYDQFFLDRGLFGDEPPSIEWTYITIFWRSIWQAGLATVLCLLIGFPTAWFIATRDARMRTVWLLVVTVPYWVNLLIRTVSMKFLIRDEGPLNAFLLWTGVIDQPLGLINTNLAVQLGLFYSYLPFMVLPIYAAVERYDFALSEAAADLYADRWTILRLVILPVVKPGLVAGCILVFVPSLGAFLAPDLLGGAKSFMIGSLIEEQFKGAAGNWPFGAAAAMILMTIVMIVLLVYARSQTREAAA
ncbi:MAG: ABC transporter permease [Rhodobacteraceae bacterium]|uniref:Spermidine/putrescine transport system permease protein n=1 Tax=Salipiger thiooxidans TaxID=282683 RepID=A0A1G7ISP1_9RHOB|nr:MULTISPECIES: ABC transporter permease [Salipiger]NVK61987.1 ABC transporter permease [Paracoccaceae bacterium]SDF15752.1 spermidine/putrescine transport system permease protein [Salipiger thiooxidans]